MRIFFRISVFVLPFLLLGTLLSLFSMEVADIFGGIIVAVGLGALVYSLLLYPFVGKSLFSQKEATLFVLFLAIGIGSMFLSHTWFSSLVGGIFPPTNILGMLSLAGIFLLFRDVKRAVGGRIVSLIAEGATVAFLGISSLFLFFVSLGLLSMPNNIQMVPIVGTALFLGLVQSVLLVSQRRLSLFRTLFVGLSAFIVVLSGNGIATILFGGFFLLLGVFILLYRQTHIGQATASFLVGGLLLILVLGGMPQASTVPIATPTFFDSLQSIQIYTTNLQDSSSNKFQIFFGAGPGMFEHVWEKSRPTTANQTEFWNAVIPTSGVFSLDVLAGFGFLGVLTLFVFSAFLARKLIVSLWNGRKGERAYSMGAVFLLPFLLFSSPHILLFGLFVFGLARSGVFEMDTNTMISKRSRLRKSSAYVFAIITFVVISSLALAGFLSRSVPEADFTRAVLSYAPHDDGYRALAFNGQRNMRTIVEGDDSVSEQELFAIGQQAIADGKRAVSLNPHDAKNHLGLAVVYAQLAAFGAEGAVALAHQSFENAQERSGSSPLAFYLHAEFSASVGEEERAKELLVEALRTRPQYPEARALKQELEIEE